MRELLLSVYLRRASVTYWEDMDPPLRGRKTFQNNQKIKAESLDSLLWSSLPESLVEEVIARLPFKLFYQCYLLSFASSTNDIKLKYSVTTKKFHEVVASLSHKWPVFCPVYLFRDGIVGYNNETQSWQKVFDLKVFPFIPTGIYTTRVTCGAGSLISFASVDFSVVEGEDDEARREGMHWKYRLLDHEVYVVNVVTRKWVVLPKRPNMQRPDMMYMVAEGRDHYKLILVTQLGHVSCVPSVVSSQVYDSLSKSWTEKCSQALMPNWKTCLSSFAYRDGVLFITFAGRECWDQPILMTHDLKEGTWRTMIPALPITCRNVMSSHVLVCGTELLLIVRLLTSSPSVRDHMAYDPLVRTKSVQIFKLDLASGQIKEEAKCPLDNLAHISFDQITASDDSVYFGGRYFKETPLVAYNVVRREWTYHSSAWQSPGFLNAYSPTWDGQGYSRKPWLYFWTNYAVQPGLNPFASV